MRQVLLELALTSNAGAARMDASSGGGSARYYTDTLLAGTLGPGDAPHLHYAELYAQAETEEARERVFQEARETLQHIRRSSGDPTRVESRKELHARIVEHGEWVPKEEMARRARTSVSVVVKARRDAGRDEDLGLKPRDMGRAPPAIRRARVRELDEKGSSAKQIAFALGLKYSTVLRDLGRKD
jgi:hypothetical protein